MSKVDLAKGPYTITSTGPEDEYYKFEDNRTKVGKTSYCTSGFWDDTSKGPIGATACTEKPEEIKPSDVPYEKYMEVVHENEVLKHIIVELNKQLYRG